MFGLIASGLASVAGGAISAGLNANSQAQVNARNEQLQREQWAREDSAYQRSVADMQKAGLNPLNGVSPASSALSANMQGADYSAIGEGINSAVSNMISLKNIDFQNKMEMNKLRLEAVSRGLNPDKLFDNSDLTELASDYRHFLQSRIGLLGSQKTDLDKSNASDSHRYSSSYGKIINDIFDFTKKYGKGTKIQDSKSAHSEVYKPSSTRKEEKSYGDRVQEYYYNSAKKNKNSISRSFANFIRAKVFKK